jgi:hypothetical protein
MAFTEGRRVVSAPIISTPIRLRSLGPPAAYSRISDENDSSDGQSKYGLHFPSPSDRFTLNLEDPLQQTLFKRLLNNLQQLYFLMVMIWADLLILMSCYPFHTVYFLSTEAGKDVVNNLFQFIHDMWHFRTSRRCMYSAFLSFLSNLWNLAGRFVETIEWWWSAWKVKVERKGLDTMIIALLTFTGKGNGLGVWSTTEFNSYWPFQSQSEMFAYLDAEFLSVAGCTSKDISILTSVGTTQFSRTLPMPLLKEYLEAKKEQYGSAADPVYTPDKLNHHSIQLLLRSLNTSESANDLDKFAADFYGVTIPLFYVSVENSAEWILLNIGVGNFGGHQYTTVKCGKESVKGVAIGMIKDSYHMVLIVPGGGVYLAMDQEDESIEHDLLPFTFARVLRGLQDIGLEGNFEDISDEEVNISHG